MQGCAIIGRWRQLGAAGILSTAVAGCWSAGGAAVHDAARPQADAILSDAPSLLPQVPVTSTTATRGQKSDIQPASGTTAANNGQIAVRLRATVNGIPILDDEVREAMAQYVGELIQTPEALRPQKQQQIYERELNRLVERELVLEEAERRIKQVKPQLMEDLKKDAAKEADKQLHEIKTRIQAKSDDEFKAMLQSQGLSEGGMRRQFERNFMMIEYARNIIFPKVKDISLQQVRDYYEQHAEEFKIEDRVTWQDIFIDASRFQTPAAAQQYAEQVRAQAAAGVDFAALVEKCDHGDSRLRKGAGLGQKHGEIVPAQVEPTVWSLKAGQVGPLVDMGFGFHIVRVAERQYAGMKPFDVGCQAEIRKKIQGQGFEREYKQMVEDLKKKATVTVYQ